MDYGKLLSELISFPAVSGYEMSLTAIIKTQFKNHCHEIKVDDFYNVVGIKKGTQKDAKKIMVSAHYDEIGMLVKSIDDAGFIKFTNIGGIDSKILLAQEVLIHGKQDVIGVIGAKPPHLLKPEEVKKAVKLEDLSIDTGLSSEKLKELVSIGDAITFKAPLFTLKGNKISSKSMDNRVGVAVLIGIMETLSNVQHEADIYFVATTQEEVGLRGAVISAYNIDPDIAIVIDGCHGDMPDTGKDDTYPLGKGPAIAVGPNLHKRQTQKIIEIAKNENIPYQIDVEPGDTGTEAWATQVSRTGIPSLLISVPLRYMHTTVETLHITDIENTCRLVAKFIESAKAGMEEPVCY